jgi:hypothetical protein
MTMLQGTATTYTYLGNRTEHFCCMYVHRITNKCIWLTPFIPKVTNGHVPRQLAIHHADRQQSISIYCTDFTYNIRQHISSLRGIQELPEDGNKLPKHVGAQG